MHACHIVTRFNYIHTKITTTVLSYVTVLVPTVNVNCTTDYANQTRRIHVMWFLNSSAPGDIERVVACNLSINCGNGSYRDEVNVFVLHS